MLAVRALGKPAPQTPFSTSPLLCCVSVSTLMFWTGEWVPHRPSLGCGEQRGRSPAPPQRRKLRPREGTVSAVTRPVTSAQPAPASVLSLLPIVILCVHALSGCTSELRNGTSWRERGAVWSAGGTAVAARPVLCGSFPSTRSLDFLWLLSGQQFGAVPAPY